ncbi:hypothetical protein KIW84_010106 [Lathyrus oleraceus]|uniref:Pentatricopeptide repeat-containing protein n=1 Tax=Pisum sativum TaxID=3888 RepID=A0A9D5BDT0_PEA|nr:hypothetical protein KIW84_010106 [Pisum sativum]
MEASMVRSLTQRENTSPELRNSDEIATTKRIPQVKLVEIQKLKYFGDSHGFRFLHRVFKRSGNVVGLGCVYPEHGLEPATNFHLRLGTTHWTLLTTTSSGLYLVFYKSIAFCSWSCIILLINELCKVGREEDGLSLLEETKTEKKICQTLLHIICLLDGLCKAGNIDKARELFNLMNEEQVQPKVVTLNTLYDGVCKNRQSL